MNKQKTELSKPGELTGYFQALKKNSFILYLNNTNPFRQ